MDFRKGWKYQQSKNIFYFSETKGNRHENNEFYMWNETFFLYLYNLSLYNSTKTCKNLIKYPNMFCFIQHNKFWKRVHVYLLAGQNFETIDVSIKTIYKNYPPLLSVFPKGLKNIVFY